MFFDKNNKHFAHYNQNCAKINTLENIIIMWYNIIHSIGSKMLPIVWGRNGFDGIVKAKLSMQ